jgi:two-component system, OmpR family, phosphate regulon sensor histidine kinase PhoR
MFRSIRWRIAVPYALAFTVIILGLGFYLARFFRQAELGDLERELAAESRLLADILANRMDSPAETIDLDTQAVEWSQILGARVTIVSPDGTVLGESHEDRATMDNHLQRPEIQESLSSGVGRSIRFSSTVGFDLMYVAVPVHSEDVLLGFVRVAIPLEQIEARMEHLQRTLLITTLVAALLVVALAMLISSYTTRPLRSLTRSVQSMSIDDLIDSPSTTTKDEVGQLASAFISLGAQLQNQIGALEAERTKLVSVLDQMTDGVLIIDAQGQVQLVNPAAQRIFGVSERSALGNSIAEVIRHHQLVELWKLCQETGQSQVTSVDLTSRRMLLQSTAIPLSQALPGSVLMVFQDLTQVRRLENIRRDFVSNISHELRTPLASLKALTETLQESALDDPPAARRFLSRMETEVDSLSLMVQELLELSRIESGKVPLQLEPVGPTGLLTAAVGRLGLQAERAGLQISIQSMEDLPSVLADPRRIEQVVTNLLHNAIKFTPPGGRIELAAEQAGDMIQFSVRDTGAGISTESLPRIFERFYKADQSRTGGGTGLGLAITRHLVEAHGGRVWAESVEGQGATFYFTLPVAT